MVDAGHEVIGVHLALNRQAATLRESARGCCTLEDAADARRVADLVGIPFYVWDLSAAFEQEAVSYTHLDVYKRQAFLFERKFV